MSTRPRLVRSIPFWGLLVASLALIAVGAWIVTERVGRIEAGVVSQTPDGAIDVYASPSVVTAGAAILGAGLIGLLLTLAVAAASTLRPRPPVEVVEPIDWDTEAAPADESDPTAGHGYERGLGYTEAIDTAPATAETVDEPSAGKPVEEPAGESPTAGR